MKSRIIGRCTGILKGREYVLRFEADGPQLGFLYELDDITEHSKAQRAAFHALLNAFYEWMNRIDTYQFEDNGRLFDFRVPSAKDFREYFKYQYGPNWFEYVDDDYQTQKVKLLDDIPTHILTWKKDGKTRYELKMKSMADYTKTEYRRIIDALFDVIHAVSCHDRRVLEIMDGMSHD